VYAHVLAQKKLGGQMKSGLVPSWDPGSGR